MSSVRKSTLQVIGIPNEFGVILLTLLLILAISPYLGGSDLGIFKVPKLSPTATVVLYFLGPILLIVGVLVFLPLWGEEVNSSDSFRRSVESSSKYRLQSIIDIVRVEAANHGLHIDGIQIRDRLKSADRPLDKSNHRNKLKSG